MVEGVNYQIQRTKYAFILILNKSRSPISHPFKILVNIIYRYAVTMCNSKNENIRKHSTDNK